MTSAFDDYNKQVIEQFRANNGNMPNGAPMLLLSTVGAKSGKSRLNPLVYSRDGDRYIVIASKNGAPTNPDWYHNLVANPDVSIDLGSQTMPMKASIAEGAERDRLFEAQAALMPNFAEYQTQTTRRIPVVILEPKSSS